MRTDPIFNLKDKKKTKRKSLTLGLLVTGLLSLIIISVTIYGQFTGTFLISVSPDMSKKGFEMSIYEDFRESDYKLSLTPIQGVEDIIEENIIRIDEILESPGGHYIDPDGVDDYIAYNFYIRNNGEETINIKYNLRIVEAYKKLDEALTVIIYKNDGTNIAKDNYYKQQSNIFGGEVIYNFRPEEIIKFTIIAFIDGHRSNPEMLNGRVKINLLFSID